MSGVSPPWGYQALHCLHSVINNIREVPDLSRHTLHIDFHFSVVLAGLENLQHASCCFCSPMVIVAIVTRSYQW